MSQHILCNRHNLKKMRAQHAFYAFLTTVRQNIEMNKRNSDMDIDKIFDTVFVSSTSILKLKNARLDTRARDKIKLPQNNLFYETFDDFQSDFWL